MAVRDMTPQIARQLGVPEKTKGVVVTDVEEGSLADEVGIQPRDIILQVNQVNVGSLKDYQREIAKPAAKNSILLLIKRGKTTYYVALRR
ncbi:MAG: PDZ domain-containing protein, partial [Candidatus Omnitrophica bacterium]|nr:PDZ domain-containing protein [Candidatus Omnitrophota bacterium]